MPIFSGSSAIASLKVGTSQVSRAYLGSTLIWTYEHSVSVPDLNVNTANGAQSFTRTATVSDGTGPFTYAWTIVSGSGFTLASTTSVTVTINSTGTNTLKEGVIRCTVTDTGNGNLVRSDDASIAIQHGTPL
jgi:hypothetical protein